MRSSRDDVDCAPPELPVKLRSKSITSTTSQLNRPGSQYDNLTTEDYFSTTSSIVGSRSSLRNSCQESFTACPHSLHLNNRHGIINGLRDFNPVEAYLAGEDKPPPLPPKKKNIMAYVQNAGSYYRPTDAALNIYRASVHTYYSQQNQAMQRQVESSFMEHRSYYGSRFSNSSGSDESMWSTASSANNSAVLPPPYPATKLLSNVSAKLESAVPPLPPKKSSSSSSVQTGATLTANSLPSTRSSSPSRPGPPSDSGASSQSGGSSPTSTKPEKYMKGPLDAADVTKWLVFKAVGDDGPEIRGGTMDALIVKATEVNKTDFLFQEAFITTYRTFISPKDLIDKLLYRHNKFLRVTDTRQKIAINAFALLVRVVDDLCVSDCSDELMKTLSEFVNQMVTRGDTALARLLRDKTAEKMEAKRSAQAVSAILLPSVAISTKVNTLTDFKSKAIAEQMSLLDLELFAKIEVAEVLVWAKEQKEELIPNLTKFTEHFNKMSYWTRSHILLEEDARDREKLVAKLIKVLKHLRKLNNFNSFLAITSALESSPISRLEWPKSIVDEMKEHSSLIDSSSSFKTYRQVLAETERPCIPYIGIILQDLTFVNEGNSDTLPDGNINFAKRWQQFNILDQMRRFRHSQYPFKRNEAIVNFFAGFDTYLHEEAMWQISESIKPRARK